MRGTPPRTVPTCLEESTKKLDSQTHFLTLEKHRLGLRCGSRLLQLTWIRPGADDEEEELPEFDFEKDLGDSIMEQTRLCHVHLDLLLDIHGHS